MGHYLINLYDAFVGEDKLDVLAGKLRRVVCILQTEFEGKIEEINWLCRKLEDTADVLDPCH